MAVTGLVLPRVEARDVARCVVIPSSVSFDPSSRTERCEPQASSAPIRDLVRCVSDSPHEVPDSLAALGFRDDGWKLWLAGIRARSALARSENCWRLAGSAHAGALSRRAFAGDLVAACGWRIASFQWSGPFYLFLVEIAARRFEALERHPRKASFILTIGALDRREGLLAPNKPRFAAGRCGGRFMRAKVQALLLIVSLGVAGGSAALAAPPGTASQDTASLETLVQPVQ